MDPGKLVPAGTSDSPNLLVSVKFAQLPNPKTGIMRAICSDASTAHGSATVGTALAGGGANIVPCYSDGTTWRYG